MRYKHEFGYKTKDYTREIKLKLKDDETVVIIWDDEKHIGAGIKLEKEVAIRLAGKILKLYNKDFVFSEKISKNLEKIEWKLDDTYETMVEHDFSIDSSEVLELKDYIVDLIREINL